MRRPIFPDAVIHNHRKPGGSDDHVVTIGIDLGDRKRHACVLDAPVDVFRRGTFASTRERIATFLVGARTRRW